MRKLTALLLSAAMTISLSACGGAAGNTASQGGGDAEETTYNIGVCNYMDHASLNQIVDSLEDTLDDLEDSENVDFDIQYQNANADANVMDQIIADFISQDVDLMVGIATPVAMSMQAATEDNQIPVVFAAVSDPVATGIVDSMEAPGANITGTSDFLDSDAVMNLIFAANPDAKKIGLLYDVGQDSSTGPIESAKAYLDEKGVEYVERTGTNADEVALAAKALVSDGVDAVFTPTDNTIMNAELAIYETFSEAKIPHYTGADSFALNGAFLGYGVDYEKLGEETAAMVNDILVNGAGTADTPVQTFDNGTATINTEICEAIGFDLDDIKTKFEPLCTQIIEIQTAEEFDD